jgi:hypothetical protein
MLRFLPFFDILIPIGASSAGSVVDGDPFVQCVGALHIYSGSSAKIGNPYRFPRTDEVFIYHPIRVTAFLPSTFFFFLHVFQSFGGSMKFIFFQFPTVVLLSFFSRDLGGSIQEIWCLVHFL